MFGIDCRTSGQGEMASRAVFVDVWQRVSLSPHVPIFRALIGPQHLNLRSWLWLHQLSDAVVACVGAASKVAAELEQLVRCN